jgi:hypothetical protein
MAPLINLDRWIWIGRHLVAWGGRSGSARTARRRAPPSGEPGGGEGRYQPGRGAENRLAPSAAAAVGHARGVTQRATTAAPIHVVRAGGGGTAVGQARGVRSQLDIHSRGGRRTRSGRWRRQSIAPGVRLRRRGRW